METYRYKRCFNKALIFALSAIILIYRNRNAITYPIFMAITLGLLAWDCKSMGKSLIRYQRKNKHQTLLLHCPYAPFHIKMHYLIRRSSFRKRTWNPSAIHLPSS